MKAIRTVAFFMFLGLVTVPAGSARSAFAGEPAWLLLDENQESEFYFDKNSPVKVEGKVEQVTARVIYTPKGKAEALKLLKPAQQYEDLRESRYVYHLDCGKEKSKLVRVDHLKPDGKVIKSFDLAAVTPWEDIPPKARLMFIYMTVCAP